MTIKIDQRFTNFTTATPEYPFGAAKNETVPRQSNDGTTVQAIFINDNYGYICAVLAEAGIEPSNQPDNAIVSDVLKAQKTIFMPQLIDGGDWSNVAGSQITRLNSRQFWLYQGESYVVSPSVTNFPIVAPDDPTTQPSIYIKARFITRSEFDVYKESVSQAIQQANETAANLATQAEENATSAATELAATAKSEAISESVTSANEYTDTKSQAALESANEYTDEQAAIIVKKAVPVGSLVDFAIEKDREGYLRCDGAAYLISSYPELGAEIGDFFNKPSDPVSVFRVPNMPIEPEIKDLKSKLDDEIANSNFRNPSGLAAYTIDGVNYLAVVDASSSLSGSSHGGVYIYDLNNTSRPAQTIANSDFRSPHGLAAYTIDGVNYLAVVDVLSSAVFIYDLNNLSSPAQTIANSNFYDPRGLAAYTIGGVNYLAVVDASSSLSGSNKGGVYVYDLNNLSSPVQTIANSDFNSPRGLAAYTIDGVNYLAVVDWSSFSIGLTDVGVYIYALDSNRQFQIVPYIKS
jgi:hypothetical protein